MTAPAPRTIADLAAPLDALEARLQAGRLAEQRHQVFDLDADSQYPVPASLTAVAR